jgi:hypothetical protein
MRHIRRQYIFVLGIMLALMMAAAGSASERWISLNGGFDGEKPEAFVRQSNDLETIIEFTLHGFAEEEITEASGSFMTLSLPEYYTTLEIGRPQLPAISELVAIPGNTDMRISVIDSIVEILEGYEIYPFQTPLLEDEIRTKFDIDEKFYATDQLYPQTAAELLEPAIWRDLRITNLRCYPMRWNPVSKKLVVYKKLVVKIEYFGVSDKNVLGRQALFVTQDYDQTYRSNILNYDFLNIPVSKGDKVDYDLLIIYHDPFATNIAPLVTWKNSVGISTQTKALSTIPGGATAQNIKNYINTEYQNNHIRFVLLVGDIANLPIYTGYSGMISDYWYALLSGNDDFPEIAVGRFSSTVAAEITNMVNKSISFGNATGSWKRRALLVAHKEGGLTKYEGCKERIRTAAYNNPPTFYTCYGRLGCTNANVNTNINGGRGLVNYRGHGSATCWTTWNTTNQSYCAANVNALTNGSMTPICLGIACNNNQLDNAGDCLGESFTKVANKGAVAYLGATRPSGTTANHAYDEKLFKEFYDNNNAYIGVASNNAAVHIINTQGSSGLNNARMYLWLGDPSLTYKTTYTPSYAILLFDFSYRMGGGRLSRAVTFARSVVSRFISYTYEYIAIWPFALSWPKQEPYLDWTRDEDSLMTALTELEDIPPEGPGALADGICEAADYFHAKDIPDSLLRRIYLFSAGGEDSSTGDCSGPPDPGTDTSWCDDPYSWQCRVLNKVLLDSLMFEAAYYGNTEQESYFCEYLDYSGGAAYYYWVLPDGWGDNYFNMRFTPHVGYSCTLLTAYVGVYPGAFTGSPDIEVTIWDDDGFGFPGVMLAGETIPYESLPTTPAYVPVSFAGYNLAFDDGEEFHVGVSYVSPGDTLAILSDDGSQGQMRSSEYYAGYWGLMLDDWGIDVNFLIGVDICCGETYFLSGTAEQKEHVSPQTSVRRANRETGNTITRREALRISPEGGRQLSLPDAYTGVRAPDRQGQDEAFLSYLASASGGSWYDPADTAVCGNGVLEEGEECEYSAECQGADLPKDVEIVSVCIDCGCTCICTPGETNNNGVINILDITYLINYLYKGGPAPAPFALCSGDANCNCVVNILDVTYLISYLYKGGPAPCECRDWVWTNGCGISVSE